MTLDQLIRQAGGYAAVARALGISRQAVYQWKHVPREHMAAVAELAGVRLEEVLAA